VLQQLADNAKLAPSQAISISAKIGVHLAKGFFSRMRILSRGLQSDEHLAQTSNLDLALADVPMCDLRIRFSPLSALSHDHGDGLLHLDLRLASAIDLIATDAETRAPGRFERAGLQGPRLEPHD
jgi:hypothetical protein